MIIIYKNRIKIADHYIFTGSLILFNISKTLILFNDLACQYSFHFWYWLVVKDIAIITSSINPFNSFTTRNNKSSRARLLHGPGHTMLAMNPTQQINSIIRQTSHNDKPFAPLSISPVIDKVPLNSTNQFNHPTHL